MQIITMNYQGFTISAIYIPPSATTDQISTALAKPQILSQLEASDQVMGDFNMDLLKVSKHVPTTEFVSVFTTSGFFPLISQKKNFSKISADPA